MRRILGIASVVSIAVAFVMAIFYAPTESTMGLIQRIFYFHLPQAILSYMSAILLGIGSVMYLKTRDLKWDRFAYCNAELGVLFTATTLITGMIWAGPVWNVWWAGDARTNLELILGLLLVGYLMLRSYVGEREKRARLSTVFGFLAVLDVPVNYGAIYWWDTMHPKPVLGPKGGGADPAIKTAVYASLLAFSILYAYLLMRRLEVARIEEEAGELEAMVETV